jgi:Family of unknown function (DUF6338)
MALSTDALTVLLVLLPGFICAKLIRWLCPRSQQTEMEKVVDALLYSFIVYAIFVLIFGVPDKIVRSHVAVLAVIPFVLAALVSFFLTNDFAGGFLRWCRLTHRTTRPSIWHDVFHKYSGYVLVELGDSPLVFGWVEFYSDFPNPPTLFLKDACWIDRTTEKRNQIAGAGVLISGEFKSIGFYTAKDTTLSAKKT